MTALHDNDATAACASCGLARTGAVVTTQTIKPPLREVEAAQFENDRQALLVWNPDPEVNSIGEHLAAMLRDGADTPAQASAALRRLRELLESNARERGHQHTATGHLSLLHRTLHTDGRRTVHGLAVTDAVRRLRGPLRVIRQARTPGQHVDWLQFCRASWTVKDVIGLLPAETLRGSYLRHELGAGPHDLMLDILDTREEPVA